VVVETNGDKGSVSPSPYGKHCEITMS
jgi:hypothetical protein